MPAAYGGRGGWLFTNRAVRPARRDMANTPPRARYLRYAGDILILNITIICNSIQYIHAVS